MGVGYCVSALHRITYLDTSAMSTRAPVQGRDSTIDSVAGFLGANVGEGAVRFRSPILEDILAWRERLATKYRDQLDEGLTGDEGGTFETSEDVATRDDVMFHYVAAVLDRRGQSKFRQLIDVRNPPPEELDAVFVEASRPRPRGPLSPPSVGSESVAPLQAPADDRGAQLGGAC